MANLDLMQDVENSEVHVNMYFMGLEEGALWFYGPLVMMASLSLVSAFYFIVNQLVNIVSFLLIRLEPVKTGRPNIHGKRRTIALALLVGSIPFYLPYQFAYTVCCIVQAVVVIRSFALSSHNLRDSIAKPSHYQHSTGYQVALDNYKNFNLSLLLLLLWILPVNVPVLIVWLHNFCLKWATPFSSHHNLLAILPILIVVQGNVNGLMISKPGSKLTIFCTKFMLIYFALYSLIYGTRHMFWLHHLLDLTCAWFTILLVDDWWNGRLQNIYSIRKEEASSKLH
ncbi:unnamed protein product [Ambrosiozyma monospora]|uniref:Unnamed protein product n=1 Tax=Ambrosiozyma monospora TaxID=43982 RepID=A0A9W6Z6H6_AMBMO|nr:unnamed protein product [Ambrosiozyma monospora]